MIMSYIRSAISRTYSVWGASLTVLVCLALISAVHAALPPPSPGGGYPDGNTAAGTQALLNLTTGQNNTALGFRALNDNNQGNFNTAVGSTALTNNHGGNRNTATGARALSPNSEEGFNTNDNTANGFFSLKGNSGNKNTAVGSRALFRNSTGNNNTAFGNYAGSNLTTGDNNIDIGNLGVAGESGTIRIGSSEQTRTFIGGITGQAVSGAPVYVNAASQLGTLPSSERFKEEIKPMGKASEAILDVEPVTFRYKKQLDSEHIPQFGLVAEKVAAVNPDLVVRDTEGKPYTVRYDAVNAMLLNEFLKEHQKVQHLESALEQLTARLKEQDSKVQQMSDQFAAARISFKRPPHYVVVNP
jgi:hypothetical protein